eukprot:365192-Chlamydomonas_euryale.AAC.24
MPSRCAESVHVGDRCAARHADDNARLHGITLCPAVGRLLKWRCGDRPLYPHVWWLQRRFGSDMGVRFGRERENRACNAMRPGDGFVRAFWTLLCVQAVLAQYSYLLEKEQLYDTSKGAGACSSAWRQRALAERVPAHSTTIMQLVLRALTLA